MLIICKECGGNVSDKAVSCPHCGFPLIVKTETKQNKTSHMRLPNGFGTIKRLSGNRRRPYVAFPSVKEYSLNGSPILEKALGYYETYNQAYMSLLDYNNSGKKNDCGYTFSQVYDMWFDDKYVKNKKREYSNSTIVSTKSSYKNCKAIHDMPINDIRLNDLQGILDNSTLRHASLELIVNLLRQVFDYAMKYDYIEKDYSKFMKINILDDDEKGIPFTQKEIKVLWNNSKDPIVQIILIMIYTGFRITEMKSVKLDKENRCYVGGIKTDAGKNRTVPIHNDIWDFCLAFEHFKFTVSNFRERQFYPTLQRLGLDFTSETKHTPHDCRHTFSWLCDKYGVDSTSKHILMGHSLQGDVENTVYAHRTTDDLRKEINKIVTQ